MNRIIALLGLLIIFSCSQNPNEVSVATERVSAKQDQIYQVTTARATYETLSYPIQAKGIVEARSFTPITFEVSGLVKSVEVNNASYVKKGQLIASLRNELQQIEVEEAEFNYESVRVNFESRLNSFGDSVNNPDNWLLIKDNVGLLVGLPSARVGLKRAQFNLEKTAYHAPFTGLVEGLELKPGQSVIAMQPIGRIVDQNSLEVLCNVLEFDLGKLSVGDSAAVFPLAYPGSSIEAVVREINPKVEPSGYVKVRLKMQEGHRLLEGMATRVEIYVPESQQILVSKSAVVKKSGRDVIFTVEGALAKWNYVTLGKENGRKVEVLQGLDPNAEVIISNNLQLAHDSPVRTSSENAPL